MSFIVPISRTDHLSHHDHQPISASALSSLCKQCYKGFFQAFSGRIFLRAHFCWTKHRILLVSVSLFSGCISNRYNSASPTLTPRCSQLHYSASGIVHPSELNPERNNSIVILRIAEYCVSYQADSSWLCIRLQHSEHLPDFRFSTNSLVQVLLFDALQREY